MLNYFVEKNGSQMRSDSLKNIILLHLHIHIGISMSQLIPITVIAEKMLG